MSVNARGIFLGCRGVLPYMLRANYGRIVNIASVAGKEGNAGMLAYSASKGAVSCGDRRRGGDAGHRLLSTTLWCTLPPAPPPPQVIALTKASTVRAGRGTCGVAVCAPHRAHALALTRLDSPRR